MRPNKTGLNQHDEFGNEVPDITPVTWPVGVIAPETLQETIARLVQVELAMQADDGDMDDIEEADDFDVDDADEIDMDSQYEVKEMQEEVPFSAIDSWQEAGRIKEGQQEEVEDDEGGREGSRGRAKGFRSDAPGVRSESEGDDSPEGDEEVERRPGKVYKKNRR